MTALLTAVMAAATLAAGEPAVTPAPAPVNVLAERTLFEPPYAHPRSPEFALVVL
ncbi:MAG: hypothetical protein INH37_27255, partial [Myxococcaceae bacterium]|nr:hypothetical protein [Myxococcaceae bacterium]